MLDEYEDLAVLYVDETLDKTHVQEFFGRGIVQINANRQIKKILTDYNDDDSANNYNNLMTLLWRRSKVPAEYITGFDHVCLKHGHQPLTIAA